MFFNFKLFFYMQENYTTEFDELTSLGSFGPGLSVPSKWLPFVFGDNKNKNDFKVKENIYYIKLYLKIAGFSFLVFLFLLLIWFGHEQISR